jgi:hypothetical protein
MTLDSLERRVEQLETEQEEKSFVVVPAVWVEIIKKRYGLTDDQIIVGSPRLSARMLRILPEVLNECRVKRQKNMGIETENGSG